MARLPSIASHRSIDPSCCIGIANGAEQLQAKDRLGTTSTMGAGNLVDCQLLKGRLREASFLAAFAGHINNPNPEIYTVALQFDLIAFVTDRVDAMNNLASRQLLGPALDMLAASAGKRDAGAEAVRSHGSRRNPFEFDKRLLDLGPDRVGLAKLHDSGFA